MKKACAVVLSILLMLCLTNVAFASGLETSCVDMALAEAAQIAYLDLEDASAEMREPILAAREEIIFSTDWVADGYTAYVEDQDGNIIRTLPAFSEVFPDWDLPVSETTYQADIEMDFNALQDMDAIAASSGWESVGFHAYYLEAPGSTNTEPFTEMFVDPERIGNELKTYATSLSYSTSCNIGYTDMADGTSIAHATRLACGEACTVSGVRMKIIGIRASTYSTPGWAGLQIDSRGKIIHV